MRILYSLFRNQAYGATYSNNNANNKTRRFQTSQKKRKQYTEPGNNTAPQNPTRSAGKPQAQSFSSSVA